MHWGLPVHVGATTGGFSLLQGRDKMARSLHRDRMMERRVHTSGTGSKNVSAMSMPIQSRDPAALLSISPEARASIRFSLGRSNTTEQIDALIEAVVDSVAHLRKISPLTPAHA